MALRAPRPSDHGLTTTKAAFIEQAQAEGRLYIHQPYELYSADNHDAWHRLFTRMEPIRDSFRGSRVSVSIPSKSRGWKT